MVMLKKLPKRYGNERTVKRALGIGFATIGAGIGIHSAFGGGDSLLQVSGDEEDR